MKRVLFVFAFIVAALGLVLAVTYAWNAPPMEEPLGGMVYSWNGPERREAFIKAWACGGGGLALGLIFAALGAILERLEALGKKA